MKRNSHSTSGFFSGLCLVVALSATGCQVDVGGQTLPSDRLAMDATFCNPSKITTIAAIAINSVSNGYSNTSCSISSCLTKMNAIRSEKTLVNLWPTFRKLVSTQ